jgi:hypothetical protein
MKVQKLRCWMLLAALGLTGCGARGVSVSGSEAEDTTSRLGDQIGISLADWLTKSRPDLAKLADELGQTVQLQHERAHANGRTAELLPRLYADGTLPVLNQAKFSEKAGFSLPPYLSEGTKDPALALHLARFGDVEAALKLANPADKELVKRIESCRFDRNYPVEWTRLVGLALMSAQLKLANGEIEGATELVGLHRQLRKVLDAKAATGPLGSTLLPRGRRALELAVHAWEGKKSNLCADVQAALTAWGETPPPALALAPGASRAEAARYFTDKDAPKGRLAFTRTVQATRRLVELLALPVPADGVENVAAFFDGGEANSKVTELLVVYRPHVADSFPEPVHLAQHLVDHAFRGGDLAQPFGLLRQTFEGGGLKYDFVVAPTNRSCGGLARIGSAKVEPVAVALPRDFGPVHLNASFEQNRLALVPGLKSAPTLECRQARALARIASPTGEPRPEAAVLQREGEQNVLASLALRWPAEENETALVKLALPLWAAFGNPRVEGVEDANGGLLVLAWEDARTRLELRLPNTEAKAPELVAKDRPGAADVAERAAAADRFDQARRKARLDAGQAWTWLPRFLHVDQVQLGQTRAKALNNLPQSQSIRRQEIPGGVSLLFFNDPSPQATHAARQMFVHFGADGRVAEIRVRYQEGPAAPSPAVPSILELITRERGAPSDTPAGWARLWPDLPAQKPAPALYRWVDDRTILTLQRDAGGVEVTVRDNPPDPTKAVALPPLLFCGRGVEGCTLGQGKAAVLKAWKAEQAEPTADGAIVLAPAASSLYDAILVWFENDKVSRVIARQRAVVTARGSDFSAALQEAWSRDIDRLGWLRRQELAESSAAQGYGWNDDRTRVRTFVQDSDQGPRLLTEWREWPVAK